MVAFPPVVASYYSLTCIQNLDDDRGFFNVQGDIIKPAVFHQEREDVQAVVQGTQGLCLQSAGFIWVILGPEPVSRVGVHKRSWEGMTGVGMNEMQKLENKNAHLYCNCHDIPVI